MRWLLLPVGKANLIYPLCNPARSFTLLKSVPLPPCAAPAQWNILCTRWEGGDEGGKDRETEGDWSPQQHRVKTIILLLQQWGQLNAACYLVFENRGRTCTATSTLTKIFVWPMECGVNYHKLIKGAKREWMSFVLPAIDTTATSQGHYFPVFSGLFLGPGAGFPKASQHSFRVKRLLSGHKLQIRCSFGKPPQANFSFVCSTSASSPCLWLVLTWHDCVGCRWGQVHTSILILAHLLRACS